MKRKETRKKCGENICQRTRNKTNKIEKGQYNTVQYRIEQDRTGQDRIEQDRTGQDRTGQDRTGQNINERGCQCISILPLTALHVHHVQ